MILLRRPAEPPDFAERTREARQRVAEAIEAGEAPSFEPPVWRDYDYKAVLAEAQNGRCAYCESDVLTVSTGEIDHFRPKGGVTALDDDPTSWGREVPGLSNVQDRREVVLSERGYWWLAYAWDNLCFVCDRCNTGWKRRIFPVAETPRCLPPRPGIEETCLLLDPYGDENPGSHLHFGDLGHFEEVPGSRKGFETIRTLGLNRERLSASRREQAQPVYQILATLERDPSEPARTTAIDDLLRLGDHRRRHAGTVRILTEQALGLAWTDLEAARSAPG